MGLLAIAGIVLVVLGILGLLSVIPLGGAIVSALVVLVGIVLIVVDRRGARV